MYACHKVNLFHTALLSTAFNINSVLTRSLNFYILLLMPITNTSSMNWLHMCISPKMLVSSSLKSYNQGRINQNWLRLLIFEMNISLTKINYKEHTSRSLWIKYVKLLLREVVNSFHNFLLSAPRRHLDVPLTVCFQNVLSC